MSTRSQVYHFALVRPRPDQATLIRERETHTQAHAHTRTYQEPGALFDARFGETVEERECARACVCVRWRESVCERACVCVCACICLVERETYAWREKNI